NKLVAKIASDFDKPDGLTVVPPHRVWEFLDPLPVRRIPGVGPATEKVLLEMGLATIAELRKCSPRALLERFGNNGERLVLYAHGRDDRPVETSRERKSLSSERSFAPDLTDPEVMRERLHALAREVAAGLARRDLSACTVTIKVRYPDFTTVTRSLTVASPLVSAAAIGEIAERLLKRTDGEKRGVRLLGVGTANLIHQRIDQLELF
ncbi:MAG TPA: DNA polymerase IV, partial [Thermoanaerobaculia bacterium]|nr:DNA polymerase IV [Thermoanaerobaculia bacterium]